MANTRIQIVDRASANEDTRKLLDAVESSIGMVPNLIATMAQSPNVAQAYLDFSNALSKGRLDPIIREKIALTVAQLNQCNYCLSAHSAIGSKVGITDSQILDARRGLAEDRTSSATLAFAKKIVEKRGSVSDDDFEQLREYIDDDGLIVEIIGNVVLNIFTNYMNTIAGTEIDFPVAQPLSA